MLPTEQQRKMAACGYLWILSFVVAHRFRNDVFIRTHARQGMILTIVSAIVLFIPVELLVIILELILALLAVMGFYRAYQGETFHIWGETGLGIHFAPEIWSISSLEYTEESSRAEQERAAMSYVPFIALWLLWREEGSQFVRLHSVYAIWIQMLVCILGAVLGLPSGIVLIMGAALSTYGIVQALQGKQNLFPHSSGWVRRYHSLYGPWYLVRATIGYLWSRITEQAMTTTLSIPQRYAQHEHLHKEALQVLQERVHSAHITNYTWQYAAYGIGFLILLLKRTPLLIHHAVQGTYILLWIGIGVLWNNASLLYIGALLFCWFVLQVRANMITVLPGTIALEHRLLSIFFPTRHE